MDKKFKHAIDFDLNSNKKNPETLNQFKNALEGHLANPNTREYGKYLPSEGSTVRYNPVTQRVMIIDNKLEFVSGWKLDPVSSQYKNYIEKGVLR